MTENTNHKLVEKLAEGLDQLNLKVPREAQQRLIQYLVLLDKWNRKFNLTAIRDVEQMLPLHLLDSLSILPYVDAENLLDVGTGAGLPGIPLAICRPEMQVTLLDSNGKKIRFCRQVALELGLQNVTALQQRIEQHQPAQPYQLITTRAFASLPDMIDGMQALITGNTRLLAMKGKRPDVEIDQLRAQGFDVNTHALSVPGIDAERHLLDIRLAISRA